MNRRLACLDIPDFALQVFLFGHQEWADEAVVLLNRDEAGGRIIGMNRQAAELGLGRGMAYGPALGIHQGLKGGVLQEGVLPDWRQRIEEILFRFSPKVERARFRDGTWWLDAAGLSPIFPSVRPWLEELRAAVTQLGLECGTAAGTGRFSTYAASLYQPSGPVNIFSDEDAEEEWLLQVPVSCIPLKADTARLLERLKIRTMGQALKIPHTDLRRRLDPELAGIIAFIREEKNLPLQSISPPLVPEWIFPLEDPVGTAAGLAYVGEKLIQRCLEHARRSGQYVRSMVFRLEGSGSVRDLSVRPARPTRNEGMLKRLFASRLEYLDLEQPVDRVLCRGGFSGAIAPQADLFRADHQRQRHEAQKILSALQAERGADSVQYARVVDDPQPARCFTLSSWTGFGRKKTLQTAPETKVAPTAAGGFPLARRISLEPRFLGARMRTVGGVSYSGGWWNKPYLYEMAYAEFRGRTCWLSADSGSPDWKLIGWLD